MSIKTIYSLCRILHIYISTALFTLLIFFCVSGVLLNHLSWISNTDKQSGITNGKLPEATHQDFITNQSVNQVTSYFENKYKLAELSRFDWDKPSNELILDYPIPAGYAIAIIDTKTYQYSIEYQQGNVLSILNDLHKGRHSGKVWGLIIDLSAIFICLFALTGMFILFQNKRKRRLALWLTLAGTLTPIFIYWFYVPRLSGLY